VYRILARRAVQQGGIDVESFVEQAVAGGMSPDRVMELLLEDLENNGPLFGRFFRSLTGAAENTVMAAVRQGETAAFALSEAEADIEATRLQRLARGEDPAQQALLARAEVDDAVRNADPVALQEIEDVATDRLELTWIAELRNTCHLCLPLHGTTRTIQEWNELGYHPDTIHSREGWTTPCHCKRIPVRTAADEFADGSQRKLRSELVSPLKRNKVESPTGLKGNKRTARGISQIDVEKSIQARDKALESLQGRRTMRLLGQSGG
jgi:hypothetical protein